MTKVCSKCKIEKDAVEFGKLSKSKDGYRCECRECRKKESKERYANNKKYFEDYRKNNRERIKELHKKHYEENKEHYKESFSRYYRENKSVLNEMMSEYRKNNRNKLNEYYRNRRKSDVRYDVEVRIRNRINVAIKNKSNSTKELLGCDIDFYIKYLENLFVDGMSWENRGEWHIDHKVPLCKFDLTDDEQIFEAFHYTNTQPLWARDNLLKNKW